MGTVEQLHLHDRAAYRITVQGYLDERWSDWLEGMQIVSATGAGAAAQSVLAGELADQAALVGVMGVLHGLGLPLIRVEYLGQDKRAIYQRDES